MNTEGNEREYSRFGNMGYIMQAYDQYLPLPEDDLLLPNYIMAIVLNGVRPEVVDKVWGWIEGPPASGKTEAAMTLYDYPKTLYRDDFTAAGLVSSYVDPHDPDKDVSALAEAQDKCMVIKDIAAIKTRDDKEVRKLAGEWASIFDGCYNKHGGIGGNREYQVRMGFLIATIPLADNIKRMFQAIGERFVSFKTSRLTPTREERLKRIQRAMAASRDKEKWRAALKATCQTYLSRAESFLHRHYQDFNVPPCRLRRVSELGDLLARVRTAPLKGLPAPPECGNRIALQLQTLGVVHGLLCSRTKWGPDDDRLVWRVSYDTLPPISSHLLLFLFQHRNPCTLRELTEALSGKIPAPEVSITLHQFLRSDLVSLIGKRSSRRWRLSRDTVDQIVSSGILYGAPGSESEKPHNNAKKT